MASKTNVLITGASGFLGSAVRKAFLASPETYNVLSLSYTQTGDGFVQLDLTDSAKVSEVFKDFQPKWILHLAAERRPDEAEKNPEGTRKLNVDVPGALARVASEIGATIVYVSTDYVFDGTAPPYIPSSPTNPLQTYGVTKRDGEVSVLSVEGAKAIVLRVPVLYGPAKNNSDSAINILLDVVKDQSGKTYKMDHWATRFPTNTVDIGNFLVRLTQFNGVIPPILHYSAAEPFTKYEVCLIFARILGLDHQHIVADSAAPAGAGTSRPQNTQLATTETEFLGIEGGLGLSLFEEWWTQDLKQ